MPTDKAAVMRSDAAAELDRLTRAKKPPAPTATVNTETNNSSECWRMPAAAPEGRPDSTNVLDLSRAGQMQQWEAGRSDIRMSFTGQSDVKEPLLLFNGRPDMGPVPHHRTDVLGS